MEVVCAQICMSAEPRPCVHKFGELCIYIYIASSVPRYLILSVSSCICMYIDAMTIITVQRAIGDTIQMQITSSPYCVAAILFLGSMLIK